MSEQLKASIARIFLKNDESTPVGVGFLVPDKYVLTCAHVVTQALSLRNTSKAPNDNIRLDFPFVALGRILTARVVCWQPQDEEDIAVLELETLPPGTAYSVRLVTASDLWGHSFRAFGFPAGYDRGVWASGVLRDRQAGDWVQIEAINVPGHPVVQGFSGTPVWDERLEGVSGMVVESDRQAGVKTAYIIPTALLVKAWPRLRQQAIPPCPYRGLFAFREADEPYFFGRETYVEQLMEAVQRRQLVLLIGPSGSGKSSVVFAGLLPRLRRQEGWLIASFRPGAHPFRALATALIPLLESQMSETDRLMEIKKLTERLQNGELVLHDVVEHIVQKYSGMRLLLVADQFEELYTLCQEGEERQCFLDSLLTIGQSLPRQRVPDSTLVITLRADFFGYALSYRPFADALQHMDLKLGPMTRQELQEAIKKPAEKLNIQVEDSLVERILGTVSKEPGHLPLLEFALTLLWQRQRESKLTLAAYEEIGGVEQALATYAEEVYGRLSEEEQKQAQQLFVQLVRPGEGTEDTRRLASRGEVREECWSLVPILADARLVVSGRDKLTEHETVEVVHEALIRGWRRLGHWMENDREFRLWQERLRAALRQWEISNQNEGALLRGVPLVEAERWMMQRPDVSQAERAFIQLSRKYLEEEALSRELALLDATRRMDDFLSIASHELKTPLTSMKGNIELIIRRLKKSIRTEAANIEGGTQTLVGAWELIERTNRQMNRLARLVNDLLDTSRIRGNKLELTLEVCDLTTLVEEAVQEQRQLASDRTIRLEMEEEKIVPVLADADRIRQVVTNYLTNALKYSAKDQPIDVCLEIHEEMARVLVRDRGIGIPATEQKHLWERFYRVPGIEVQTGSGVGLGLGLHICRTIIERHNGQYGVQSAPGEGSTFWFTLPLVSVTGESS